MWGLGLKGVRECLHRVSKRLLKTGISKSGPRPRRTTDGVILIFGMLTGGLQLGCLCYQPFLGDPH